VLSRLRGEAVPTKANESSDGQIAQLVTPVVKAGEPENAPPKDEQPEPLVMAKAGAAEAPNPAKADLVPTYVSLPTITPRESPISFDGITPSVTEFKIETIRVEPQKLDALMTLAGEMVVTTARTVQGMSAIEELDELWEEWSRDATKSNLASAGERIAQRPLHIQERDAGRLKRLRSIVDRLGQTSNEEIGRLGLVADDMIEAIRDIRLLPFSTIFNLFLRMVRDLSREQGKEVRLEIEGGSLNADKHLLEELKDPLMHMIRNAVDHSIETPEERERQGKPREASIWLRAYKRSGRMVVEVADDGRGLDVSAIRRTALQKHLISENELAALSSEQVQVLIFAPGFSTTPLITDISGRGVGLDVVRTNIERLKGTIAVHSEVGVGCTFRIEAPIKLATMHVLLVQVGQRSYAIPIETVQETFIVSPTDVFAMEAKPCIQWESGPIRVAVLADLLELPRDQKANPVPNVPSLPGVVLAIGAERFGVFVDALLDEQEVILKPFGGLIQRVRNVLGSTILSTGEISMVLNPWDLIKSMGNHSAPASVEDPAVAERKKVLLLAEDSITTRTQEKRILESAGYEVVTAVDGVDAFNKLGTRPFDAVVTDVEMPNMTGLQLAEQIRKDNRYKELPIILVTSLASDEDRKRGVEVGANAYLTKGNFDQKLLLDTLRRLV
jgi:two-component system chemotaxis sensor kinase CheA